MKQLMIAVLILAGYALQTLVGLFDFLNIRPDLLLVICISLSIMNGPLTGTAVGFFSGVLLNIMYGMGSAIGIIQYTLVCAAAGFFIKIQYMGIWLKPAGIAVLAFIIKEIIMLIVLSMQHYNISSAAPIFNILLGAVFTGALMIPVHLGMRRIQKLRFMRRPDDERIFID